MKNCRFSYPVFGAMFLLALCITGFSQPAQALDEAPDSTRPARFELVPKKPIPYSLLGINAFVNEPRFGTIRSQFQEVKNTLKIKRVRILMRWDTSVQPSPGAKPNFSFYDDIIKNLPSGTDALVILTGLPSWMKNSTNWIDNDPRKTFVERWVRPVISRYADRKRIIGWQIWNEPNMTSDSDNTVLGLANNPGNYVAMLSRAFSVSREKTPSKLVVSAATTAINQNFPKSFQYNKDLEAGGMKNVCDIWAVHYYGSNYENLLFFGISDFLNDLNKPIWVTESGAQGTTKQLAYGQRTWALLKDLVPAIARIYIYQFTESTPASKTYGLKNITAGKTVSDLYINLRDRTSSASKK